MDEQKNSSFMDILRHLMQYHKGEVLGTAAGVAVGFMIMCYGFFWTLFICVCGVIGYKIGKRIDSEEMDWKDLIERYIPSGRR